MFCLKTDMQRVEYNIKQKLQYKTLQVVYNNYMATYDELLALDNKLKIHQRHLQFLAIEIYKFKKNKLNTSFMWKTYKEKVIPYSLRRVFPPNSKLKHSEIWKKNSLNFGGSALWNNLPIKLK